MRRWTHAVLSELDSMIVDHGVFDIMGDICNGANTSIYFTTEESSVFTRGEYANDRQRLVPGSEYRKIEIELYKDPPVFSAPTVWELTLAGPGKSGAFAQ